MFHGCCVDNFRKVCEISRNSNGRSKSQATFSNSSQSSQIWPCHHTRISGGQCTQDQTRRNKENEVNDVDIVPNSQQGLGSFAKKKLVQLSRSRAHLHSKLGSGFMEAMSLLGHCALHGQGIRVLRYGIALNCFSRLLIRRHPTWPRLSPDPAPTTVLIGQASLKEISSCEVLALSLGTRWDGIGSHAQ